MVVKLIRNDKMDNIDEILFSMVKFALIKAMSVMTIAVLFLIIGLSPLYVTLGLMQRQMINKTN